MHILSTGGQSIKRSTRKHPPTRKTPAGQASAATTTVRNTQVTGSETESVTTMPVQLARVGRRTGSLTGATVA